MIGTSVIFPLDMVKTRMQNVRHNKRARPRACGARRLRCAARARTPVRACARADGKASLRSSAHTAARGSALSRAGAHVDEARRRFLPLTSAPPRPPPPSLLLRRSATPLLAADEDAEPCAGRARAVRRAHRLLPPDRAQGGRCGPLPRPAPEPHWRDAGEEPQADGQRRLPRGLHRVERPGRRHPAAPGDDQRRDGGLRAGGGDEPDGDRQAAAAAAGRGRRREAQRDGGDPRARPARALQGHRRLLAAGRALQYCACCACACASACRRASGRVAMRMRGACCDGCARVFSFSISTAADLPCAPPACSPS